MTGTTFERQLSKAAQSFSFPKINASSFQTNETHEMLNCFDDISSLQSFCSSVRTKATDADFGKAPTKSIDLSLIDIRSKSLVVGTLQRQIDCYLSNVPVSTTKEKTKKRLIIASELDGMVISFPQNSIEKDFQDVSIVDNFSHRQAFTSSNGATNTEIFLNPGRNSPRVKCRTLLVGTYDM